MTFKTVEPIVKPAASDIAEHIMTIATTLFMDQSVGVTMRECILVAIEAAWLEVKYDIEIAKGKR